MTTLMRRADMAPEPFTLFDRIDRLFGELMRAMPVRTPLVEAAGARAAEEDLDQQGLTTWAHGFPVQHGQLEAGRARD